MADQRFRIKRTGFGATLKSQHDPFRLKGTSDSSITAAIPPTTSGTQAPIARDPKNQLRLKK